MMVENQVAMTGEAMEEKIEVSRLWLDRLTSNLARLRSQRDSAKAEMERLDVAIENQIGAISLMSQLLNAQEPAE